MTKELHQEGTRSLVEIAESMGVKVEFSSQAENAYFPLLNKICVNTRQNNKIKYYTLLHEIGHALLRKEHDFADRYLEDVYQSKAHKDARIDVLREEIAAWDKCAEFAKQNNLPFCKTTWLKYSKKYIYQYAKWTVNPRSFLDD